MSARLAGVAALVALVLSACSSGGSGSTSAPLPPPAARVHHRGSPSTPIQHVIIVIQENRSFDNLFATFPNANGTTTGNMEAVPASLVSQCDYPYATSIPLAEKPLYSGNDYEHRYVSGSANRPGGFLVDLDNGLMDGFDLSYIPASSKIDCTGPYEYVDPSQIQPYWNMASQYVLADNLFQTQGSSSFTAHQDLIAGGTVVNYAVGSGSNENSAIDNPSWWPWGCDNHSSSFVPVITTQLQYFGNEGPFPCFTYKTMRDLLDGAGVSWKFYAEQIVKAKEGAGIWSAYDAISSVRNSSEWGTKVVWPDTKIFADIKKGTLPAVSWVTPDAPNSDHPQEQCKCDTGPSWVASVVNAVGNSKKYWKSSAVIVVWDDYGGWYDHVPPPFTDNQGGLGFRVPMIVVSPFTQPHVEHTQYEFGSILRFIEDNWDLGSLGTTDQRATSIGNLFYFGGEPRAFKPIAAKYPTSYFLQRKQSGLVPDPE
ncbi:MAG TPA: alkaline phosphatase family protein [Candidatus Cybelea sp.]|nr:alkaline phosphatase family protein [Candidatus Cybelea sp.]